MAQIIRKLEKGVPIDPKQMFMGGLYELPDGSPVVFTKGEFMNDEDRGWVIPVEGEEPPPDRLDRMWKYHPQNGIGVNPKQHHLVYPKNGIDVTSFDATKWYGQDPRIIEIIGVRAILNGHDVPKDVRRTFGHGDGTEKLKDEMRGILATEEFKTRGPTDPIDQYYVAVSLDDLRQNGWVVEEKPLAKKLVAGVVEDAAKVETPSVVYPRGNSGRTYKFLAGGNDYTGEKGWRPVELNGGGKGPAFDPVNAVMTIHDLMEHFPGDEYAPHNEYMAQGAMLWLRFDGGFFSGNVENQVVPPAFGMLFHHITKGRLETKKFDNVAAQHNAADLPPKIHLVLNRLVARADSYIDEKFSSANANLLRASLHLGVPWMVSGYHAAAERYKGLDKHRLVRLYKSTAEKISTIQDGATLLLTMDYDKYESKVQLEFNTKVY